jgi:site-specific recombinase XerD
MLGKRKDTIMKLLDRLSDVAVRRHLSASTVACYRGWILDFLSFCRDPDGRWREPAGLGVPEVEQFLTHLAGGRRLSASSQNQAMCAIVFLYKHVLADEVPEGHLGRFEFERSTRHPRVPTVLSVAEIMRVIECVREGSMLRLMVELLYGTGLRVSECCMLRLRDLDFDRGQIIVRGGKGDKDRIVMLPQTLRQQLIEQCRRVRQRHERDLRRGGGYTPVPDVLEHKCPYAAFATQRGARASPSASVLIRFDIASPRTCWKPDTISARCRCCWVMHIWKRQ